MLVSTTLTGSNADIIGDALASVVTQVDRCLVVDTGAKDDTLAVARSVAGDKLVVRELAWPNDFAAARNFALDAATELGGTWAITVDTDERLVFDPGVRLSQLLGASRAQVCMVVDDLGNYSKERVVRLPSKVRWAGPTHECLEGRTSADTATLQGVRFHELSKDPAAMRRKFERDLALLKRHTRQHAKQARWYYYLGATHQQLGDYAAAIDAFRTCAELRGWEEEGAWACYRRGGMLLQLAALGRRAAVLCRRTRDPARHGRAGLARGFCGIQGHALRRRSGVVAHGHRQWPVSGGRRGLRTRRFPSSAGLVRRPVRRAALGVPGAWQLTGGCRGCE